MQDLPDGLKKISKKPFFVFSSLVSPEDVYFDESNVYLTSKDSQIKAFPFSSLVSIKKTSKRYNNRYILEMHIKHDETEYYIDFLSNYSIWNKNFYEFYNIIEEYDPNIFTVKWNIFWI